MLQESKQSSQTTGTKEIPSGRPKRNSQQYDNIAEKYNQYKRKLSPRRKYCSLQSANLRSTVITLLHKGHPVINKTKKHPAKGNVTAVTTSDNRRIHRKLISIPMKSFEQKSSNRGTGSRGPEGRFARKDDKAPTTPEISTLQGNQTDTSPEILAIKQ